MNKDNWGLIVIAILWISIFIFGAFYNANIIHTLIDDCEQHLPRDKHCHLVGVPDEQ